MSLKNQYTHRISHFLEIFSILIGLFVYFYVSRAFGGSVESELTVFGDSYFNYVVFGEIFMMIPLYFLDAPYKKIRSSIVEGTFETYLALPISIDRIILILSSWNLVQVIKRATLTLLIACLFFDFNISILSIPQLLILQVLSISSFLGLGLCISCLILFFGRGESTLGYLNTFIAISAGSFFPLSVLPQWIQSFSRLFSPFTLLLENSRAVAVEPISFMSFMQICSILTIWGLFIFLGRYLINKGVEHYRKNGALAVISHY